eukprot:SAG31_NODE_1868_length_7028_cov_4.100303_2_plen_63_part_00
MAYEATPVGKKTDIAPFPFPSPLRQQIQSGALCLGTATPATSEYNKPHHSCTTAMPSITLSS